MKSDYRFLGILMSVAILFAVVALAWIVRAIASESHSPELHSNIPGPAKKPATVYDFDVRTIDGEPMRLERFRGKTLLIVNTASRCGFTPQYVALEKLYSAYKDRGLEILAFPANNFMGQEPGTDAEIKQFCALKFKTSFLLFSKISVKGVDIHPLYRYLTTESGQNGEIGWNFTKFLVAPDGRVIARFGSRQDPMSPDVVGAVEEALLKTKS